MKCKQIQTLVIVLLCKEGFLLSNWLICQKKRQNTQS